MHIQSLGIGYGELVLKGRNKSMFVTNVRNKLTNKLKETNVDIILDHNKIFLDLNGESEDKIYKIVQTIFGLSVITFNFTTDLDINNIKDLLIKIANNEYEKGAKTFKISVKRANKSFNISSMDFAKELGATVLINTGFQDVDIKNPDVLINVEIRDRTYIYIRKEKLGGGMPQGSLGYGLSLLSGGIDSPVSSYLMIKRGLKLSYVTFHSFPFTSEKALQKVKDLVDILSCYNDKSKLYIFNVLKIQEKIRKDTNPNYATILLRRAMVRLSNRLAKDKNYLALITGESLGQVASQTAQNIHATNSISNLPIFRPLIAMDKQDIINIANKINTYEKSIEPYDDSCKLFAPKNPVISSKIENVIKEEQKIKDYEEILDSIYKEVEIYTSNN